MKRPPVTTVGAVGVAAGCAGMVSMLPGAVSGALGVIGISGSSALARALSPVAEPLFIVSAIVLTVGALACSRLVALLAVGGSVSLYLSMFQLTAGGRHGGGSMSMVMPSGQSSLHAEPVSFYLGLVLLLSAFALSLWRRRRRECRPLLWSAHLSIARR